MAKARLSKPNVAARVLLLLHCFIYCSCEAGPSSFYAVQKGEDFGVCLVGSYSPVCVTAKLFGLACNCYLLNQINFVL